MSSPAASAITQSVTAVDTTGRLRGAPAQLTGFVGRERELAAVGVALGGTRLLTLTGAGGSGKTRLALEAATRESAVAGIDGAWVELAPVRDPALVGEAVLSALGIRDESDVPPVERIISLIGERPFLLVLDNAEHLVQACAALAAALLRGAPTLRVMVTSRSALGVTGETAWLVPPLSLPAKEGNAIAESEAVQLFVQRGSAVLAGFRLTSSNRAPVAQICRRLDGLPLALELAAARLRVLTPEQIALRLDDRFRLLTTGNRSALPRHQTLRAAIDWSYELLDARERCLLARLSVFRGSCALEAVEAVCVGDELTADNVLDVMSELVDKSLVEVRESGGQARYRLLETIREYATERLQERGESEELTRAHAIFFATLMREAGPHLRTPERPEWLARLVPELDNLRQTLAWSREHDVPTHLQLVGLHWFWFSTGQWPEARQWLRGALAMKEAQAQTRSRAALLFSLGALASLQAHAEEARTLLEEAEVIAERLRDEPLLADVRNYLAMALNQAADPGAEAVVLRARPWMREANDLYALRLNFLLQGVAHAIRGDNSGAIAASEEGVRVARVFGLDRELAIALQQLAAIVARAGGDAWRRARSLTSEALRLMQRDPMPLFTSRGLELMASSASAEGESADAARLYGASDAIRTAIGAAMWRVDQQQHAPFIEAARHALGAAAFEREWQLGRAMEMDAAIELAIAIGARLGVELEEDPSMHTAEYAVPSLTSQDREPTASLSVRSLGALDVQVDGVPIAQKSWSHAKARELLLVLLVYPQGRTREQVGAALWPEASAAQVRNNFHVTLHHLRRALGHADWVRFERERYRLDVPGTLAFDARAFDDAVTHALRAGRRGTPSIEELQVALAQYRGEFLDGEPVGDWHFEVRDRLARLYVEGMESLGSGLLSAKREEEAVAVLQRLIEREPLHQSGCRALMLARARTGDTDGALREYRRLEEMLRREGSSPDRETIDLYRRLQRGEAV